MSIQLIAPTRVVHSVPDINFIELYDMGVRTLVYDLDNTLGLMGFTELSPAMRRFLVAQRHGYDFGTFRICFATNSIRDLTGLADLFDAILVQPTNPGWRGIGKRPKKPSREFYEMVLDRLGSPKPSSVAMIGDKLVADVCGAMNVGMIGILVKPLGPDLFLERLTGLRRKEARKLTALEVKVPWK